MSSSAISLIGADNSAAQLAIAAAAKEKLAQEMFHQAVEASPSGMVITDRVGKIVMTNIETERLFGYQRDELIGQRVDVLVPVRLRGQHPQHRDGYADHPTPRRMGARRDLFGLRKDGSEFAIEIGLNPMTAGEGPLVLSVVLDITERKRLERLKDEFVSTVSHELRTPLTSISGSLGLLVGGAAGSMPTVGCAPARDRAVEQPAGWSGCVNDILDIEKIEVRADGLPARVRRGACADRAGDREQSRFRRSPWGAGSNSPRPASSAR